MTEQVDSSLELLTQLAIVAAALTTIITFLTLVIKRINTARNYISTKVRKTLDATVGQAVKAQLEYTNGGSGFGDKINKLIVGHDELKEGHVKIDKRLDTVEERQEDMAITLRENNAYIHERRRVQEFIVDETF